MKKLFNSFVYFRVSVLRSTRFAGLSSGLSFGRLIGILTAICLGAVLTPTDDALTLGLPNARATAGAALTSIPLLVVGGIAFSTGLITTEPANVAPPKRSHRVLHGLRTRPQAPAPGTLPGMLLGSNRPAYATKNVNFGLLILGVIFLDHSHLQFSDLSEERASALGIPEEARVMYETELPILQVIVHVLESEQQGAADTDSTERISRRFRELATKAGLSASTQDVASLISSAFLQSSLN